MLEVNFSKIFEGREHPADVFNLFFHGTGPELLSGNTLKGIEVHALTGHVTIRVYQSRKTWVVVNSTQTPVIKGQGVLEGAHIGDADGKTGRTEKDEKGEVHDIWTSNGIKAAIGELAVYWLRKHKGWPLIPPSIKSMVGDQEMDTCLNCRWCRRIPHGSEELSLGLHFDDDGPAIRDHDFEDELGGMINPVYQCILFGTYPELEFGVLDEMNIMGSGGLVRDKLINWHAGFDCEENWNDIEFTRTAMMKSRACAYHRQRSWSFGTRTGDNFSICDEFSTGMAYENDEKWVDTVPVGWMPKVKAHAHVVQHPGILIPGATTIWCPELPTSMIEEVENDVRQSLQTGPREHEVRNNHVRTDANRQSL